MKYNGKYKTPTNQNTRHPQIVIISPIGFDSYALLIFFPANFPFWANAEEDLWMSWFSLVFFPGFLDG
jgi:hypothetical protein